MKPIYRFFFVIAFSMLPLGSLLAQPVVVRDLMPLSLGQYVEYNEYDTTSLGIQRSHASSTVDSIGETFADSTGVAMVQDTSQDSDNSAVITNLHYRYNTAGDLQVFADEALTQQVLGPKLAPGATPPNRWVTELTTNNGNTEYTIDTTNTTYSGAAVQVIFTGKYVGSEAVTVPYSSTPYSNAQRFDLTGHATISYLGNVIARFSTTETEWLVKGIGIIKTNLPRTYISIPLAGTDTEGGTEKEMTSYGVASASVSQSPSTPSSGIRFYPNPASDNLTLLTDQPASRVFLYDATGRMVRSFDIASNTGDALLWVKDLPNGAYLARVRFTNGTIQSAHFMIQH